MRKKKASKWQSFKKIILIILFLGIILGIYTVWAYRQSMSLVDQGAQLINEGKTPEAIDFFKKATTLFPFNQKAINSLKGAQLVQQSIQDYGNIAEIDAEIENAELQNIPPTNSLGLIKLKPNEVFVPILMYHHIWNNPRPKDPLWASLSVSPSQLDSEFSYLAVHNYHTITLTQLFDSFNGKFILPANPIILSFDDGYKNFYTDAFPLLKKYSFVAEEFVITQVTTYPAYLSWDQIKELDQSGLVEIGAHTRHHPDLTTLSQNIKFQEIEGSKTDIEAHLNHKINFFAYPYGSYNDEVVKDTQNAGFEGAVSTIYGANQSLARGYLLPRIMVDGRFSLDEFGKRIVY